MINFPILDSMAFKYVIGMFSQNLPHSHIIREIKIELETRTPKKKKTHTHIWKYNKTENDFAYARVSLVPNTPKYNQINKWET